MGTTARKPQPALTQKPAGGCRAAPPPRLRSRALPRTGGFAEKRDGAGPRKGAELPRESRTGPSQRETWEGRTQPSGASAGPERTARGFPAEGYRVFTDI